MANLLFASRESDSLGSENPGMSQPSRGLVLSLVLDVDCALDDVLERRALGREGHAKLQGAPLHLTLSDDALDLPLRGDAHLLEELANVYVEAVLIHRGLLRAT